MVESCLAINYTSKRTKGEKLKFHRIPKDPNRRKLWLNSIRRKDYNPGESAVIWEKHFEQEDYEVNVHGNKVLKCTSVPSVFDFPAHLKKNIKTRRNLKRKIETSSSIPEWKELVPELVTIIKDIPHDLNIDATPSTSKSINDDVLSKELLEERPISKRTRREGHFTSSSRIFTVYGDYTYVPEIEENFVFDEVTELHVFT